MDTDPQPAAVAPRVQEPTETPDEGPLFSSAEEATGEAEDPSVVTTAIGAACAVASGLGIVGLAIVCAASETVTLGAITLPCIPAMIAASSGAAACAAWCAAHGVYTGS